jgi:hypothetical protein
MTVWTPDTDPSCQIEISDDPATRGQIVRFVKPSLVHATPEEVAAENINKNVTWEAAKTAVRGKEVTWEILSDRSIKLTVVGGTKADQDAVKAVAPNATVATVK